MSKFLRLTFVLAALLAALAIIPVVASQAGQTAPQSSAISQPTSALAPNAVVTITILHTNDFHGYLEGAGSDPGMARTANVINGVRTAVGAENVALFDAGDE